LVEARYLLGGFLSTKDIIILGCSSQQPTRRRNHGAYLIRWNNEGLLFDPGEGTQRQFIFANVAPTCVNRIFISHFHGDHCLGLGSMLMRLNLDKVTHPIHCYYPAKYKKNFDYLRYGCVYHENIKVVEHPVTNEGIVEDDGNFKIEAVFLEHGIDNIGWRISEKDKLKFNKDLLEKYDVKGVDVGLLEKKGVIDTAKGKIYLKDVSFMVKGDIVAYVVDTKPCPQAERIAHDASILICESTYTQEHKDLAKVYLHMTAKEAATLAKKANVHLLILTHFSARYQDTAEFDREAKAVFANTIIAEDLKRIDFPKIDPL
jgi:ribonuclease Z